MTPSGGKREGAGRKPAPEKGKRVNLYLAADNVEWWDRTPEGDKSDLVNQAIRDLRMAEQDERKGGENER